MAEPIRLKAGSNEAERWRAEVWQQPAAADPVAGTVAEIISDVRLRGDAALLELTARLDGWQPAEIADLQVDQDQLARAAQAVASEGRNALALAAARIKDFHRREDQPQHSYRDQFGNRLELRSQAIDRVAAYVPGGTACYPSSLLMAAIPARLAGVRELVLLSPGKDQSLPAWTAAAALQLGIDEVWLIGGAQALAAAAYGTASLRRADMVVGPGNAFVSEAKRQLAGTIGTDLTAGPTELLLIGDGSAPPAWCAADLLAQAEHDPLSGIAMISSSAAELDAVAGQLQSQITLLERRAIAESSLARAALIEVPSSAAACACANLLAAEHVQLMCSNARALVDSISSCGSLFVGANSSAAVGDYCAGPNHILPTGGSARFASPLRVANFRRYSSVFEATPAGAATLGQLAAQIARAEGLDGHAKAALMRAGKNS